MDHALKSQSTWKQHGRQETKRRDGRETQEANQSYVGSHGDHLRRLLDAAQLCSPNHGVQF